MIKRFHIVGGAGSGKTILASLLSVRFRCETYDLDQVGWRDYQKVPLSERLQVIEEILSVPYWITESVFLWWTESLFEKTETILRLDVPFLVTAWRIIKRHVLTSFRGNNSHAGIINLVNFLGGVGRGYYRRSAVDPETPDDDFAITRAVTVQILAGYGGKVVHSRNQVEIDRFLSLVVS